MNLPIVSAQILGSGSYLPERCVKNSELTSLAGLDEAAIEQRTGVRKRHWAAKEEAASDLAVQAARSEFERALRIKPDLLPARQALEALPR